MERIIGSDEDRNRVCAVFLLIKGEYKTSSPYKWSSKAKMAPNAYFCEKACHVQAKQTLFLEIGNSKLVRNTLDLIQIRCRVVFCRMVHVRKHFTEF